MEEEAIRGVAKIRVIGVGGGGNNAVNRMIDAKIKSAEFIAVNTDMQTLLLSKAPKKIQIGGKLTGGLGAGADPKVGAAAAEESRDQLREALKGTDMLFITAGMGGGTGTGAAPIIASMASEMNILTVAVVTKPFDFEGRRRMKNAEEGIANLRKYVDTLVVIPNDKLMEVLSEDTSMVDAFIHADEVLRKAIQGISDLIVTPSLINLDFADVRSVMRKKGLAHMGIGEAEGPDKTINAVKQAVMSPLLETNIGGSSGIILNVVGGMNLTLMEVRNASRKVQEAVDENANIIFGAGIDETLGDKVVVTLIATGFESRPIVTQSLPAEPSEAAEHKISNEEFATRFIGRDETREAEEPYRQPQPAPYYVPKPISYTQEAPVREKPAAELAGGYRPPMSDRYGSYGAPRRPAPAQPAQAPEERQDEGDSRIRRPSFLERFQRK